jgi:hypothetical protein
MEVHMGTRAWLIVAGSLVLTAGSAGCGAVYRCETVLHSDGSVERAIYQAESETPKAARRPGLWEKIGNAPEPKDLQEENWSGSIRELLKRPAGKNMNYLAAWGRFKDPGAIPAHVLIEVPVYSQLPDRVLERHCDRADYVFVVAHRWHETLTDGVTLQDLRQARETLADLVIVAWQEIFDEALGKDYDGRDLFAWLRKEGKPWLAELTDFAYLQSAAHKGPAGQQELWKGLASICARHGLKLPAKNIRSKWEFLGDEAIGTALREFVVEQICRRVRRRQDGQPVDKDTVALWLELDRVKKAGEPKAGPPVFDAAAKKVIDKKYGGSDAFRKRLEVLLLQALGRYYPDLEPREFDYTLTVPGTVVEANGTILSDKRVRWRFFAEEAYPLGYRMECSSLEVQVQTQNELLGGAKLTGRDAVVRFVALVEGQDALLEVLRDCRKQKSLTPLEKYRQALAAKPKGEDERKRVEQLQRLLQGLPPSWQAGRRGLLKEEPQGGFLGEEPLARQGRGAESFPGMTPATETSTPTAIQIFTGGLVIALLIVLCWGFATKPMPRSDHCP